MSYTIQIYTATELYASITKQGKISIQYSQTAPALLQSKTYPFFNFSRFSIASLDM